jgi:hypothetical protein
MILLLIQFSYKMKCNISNSLENYYTFYKASAPLNHNKATEIGTVIAESKK